MKKKSFLVVSFLIIICISVSAQSKNFTFKPEKPKPGEIVTINYNPSGSELEKSEKVTMLVHAYEKAIYYTDEVDLLKKGNTWTGNFSTADTCAGVVLRFTDGENFDNNGSKCFPIRFYGNDGIFVKYASAGLASGYISWFGAFRINPDPETAFKLFEEEFTLNPQLQKDYLTQYYSAFSKVDKDRAMEFMKKETENYEKILTQSIEDLSFLLDVYTTQKLKDKIEQTKALILEKYPQSQQAEMLKVREYFAIKDAEKKIEFANKFKEQFPESKYLTYMFPDPTTSLIQTGNYEEAFEALKNNPKASSSLYNSLAWAMYEKDVNLKLAKEIVAKGVELTKTEDPLQGSPKPPYYSEKQFQKLLDNSKYAIIDTYGAILLKLGENAEALKYMTEAYEMDGGKSIDVNERYAQALLSNGKTAEAMKNLEKFISGGKGTTRMKDMLKETYVKLNGKEEGFDKYYSKFEEAAKKKMIAKLQKEMIDEPAPQFTLVDLNGNNISLADFKGKSVIIDFWATWCGPCLASFPGMKQAVEKYENTGKAKFFFVNTWENVDNKKQNAADFIAKNNYPFHVLMDESNEVITSYKVSGIPTKFIIDKNGKIRFKSVGFSGNADEMVEEIGTMLEMIQ